MTQFNEEKTQRRLSLLKRTEEEEITKLLSQKYKIPYIDLSLYPIDTDALKIIPEDRARTGELVIFHSAGKKLKIAVRNPQKEEVNGAVKRLEEDKYQPELYLASRHSLEHAWEFYKKAAAEHEVTSGAIEIAEHKLDEFSKNIRTIADTKEKIEATFLGRTTEALEIILGGALALDVSDIHIEPQEEGVRLRFRIDGVLYDTTQLPPKLNILLLSRIKLLSELKLNVHDRAQDGRFTIKSAGQEIEVRTSVLPGPYGENVVLRLLSPKSIKVTFDKLGMQPQVVEVMEKELKRPNGMIVTTGPTGSGKTTTLYSFLQKIHTPTIKIITIEDPIEYHLPGIEHTQVDADKGYDFANGLRSIVRQDPDVILVGEIRDLETAETAMHAALTGHLVFSTLHTNSAAGTIPRLLDLGVRPSIIAPAINVAMAQRLVRKLCVKCRSKITMTARDNSRIRKEISLFPKNIPTPESQDWTIFEAGKGCNECGMLGYKGRIGVFEIILIDEEVERLIIKEPSEYEIKKEAERQGQINMRQDGLLKVLQGIIDFAELEKVVGN